jgi:hypothetical protein
MILQLGPGKLYMQNTEGEWEHTADIEADEWALKFVPGTFKIVSREETDGPDTREAASAAAGGVRS